MAGALADAMAKSKVKTLGFIGFADAYGDGWLDVMQKAAKAKGIEIVAIEKYSPRRHPDRRRRHPVGPAAERTEGP
ncbi:hypothetical protein G6F32_016336 [Rhizopus arrhizus]|nr:hypothetical protein G6F32_016336 [Rhizopus arrhizus]